jgi:hypothetical protein
VSTSYGEGKAQVEIEVSPATLKKLVDDGFVIVKDDEPQKTEVQTFFENMKPYFRRFARKNGISLSACMGYFLLLFAAKDALDAHKLLLPLIKDLVVDEE